MKKFLLLICALLSTVGTWADVTVTVHDQGTQGYTTYGNLSTSTISNDTYTTTAASGLEGLTLTNSALAWNRAGGNPYFLLQGVYSSADETTNVTTITAPEGYLITGYSMEACGWNSNRTFTATAADGTTSITVNSATTQTLAVSDLKVKSTTITVVGATTENTVNNWFSIKNFTVTLAKIDFISLTFDKPGSATNNITVNVKDADGDAIPGVTATLESTSCTEFKTGSATALSRTTNSVLAPNAGYDNAQNSTITYTFKVEGLPTTFTYSKAALDVYALTGGGEAQGNTGTTVREWTFDVEIGASTDALTSFVSQSGNDICTVTDQDGGLYHKLWTMSGEDKAATDALYIKVTLTKTASQGCFAGIGEVQLYKPTATVQYVISDESGVVFTSDVLTTTEGDVITELPASLQRDYCSYSTINQTMVAGENTVNVTVTYNLPFTVSSSYADATWYYATIRSTKYLRADDSNLDSSNRFATSTTNERTDVYKWAFFGNPYSYFYIANKGQGDGKYLNAGTVPNFVTSASPASTDATLWEVIPNGTGFTLRSTTGSTLYINDAGNGGNLGYWNSASGKTDAGGMWNVEDVATITASDKALLAEEIAAAQALVDGADGVGYPISAAASTLSAAITTAQGVYDDASGDYYSAYNTLAAAVTTATATENINYTPRTDVYYTITSDRGSMVYDSSHDSSTDADDNKFLWYTTSLDNTNVNHLWGFIEQDGKYYMYNVGKQQFATVSTSGSYQLNDKGTWVFSDTPAYVTFDAGINNSVAAPYVRVRATVATTETTYSMSISTAYTGPVITYDAQGDGGIPMMLATSDVSVDADITAAMTAKVEDLTPYRNALKEVIDGCADINFGTGVNQYAQTGDAYTTYTSALAAANSTYDNNSSTKSDLQTAMSNLEAAISGLTLNLPSAGFYRIKGATSGYYLAAGLADNSKFAMSTATDATTIFYFDGTKLTNFSSGLCNGMTASAWTWTTGYAASTVTFSDGNTSGGYAIQSSDAYFYDNGDNSSSADRGSSLGSDARYRSWTLEEVTTLPVTITDACYATLCAPVALTIPSGVTAYYISALTSTEATLTEISTTIPANTGVVLYSETPGTYDFAIADGGTAVDGNKLSGQATAQHVEDGFAYTLQKSADKTVIGLFPKKDGTIAGFKAYMLASALPTDGGEVKGVTFRLDGADGISNVNLNDNLNDKVFDLSGRRVNAPTKGLYIVNGKKVLVK